jgi:transcription initiation factor TFIIIB Brf1 subunit/transcription initiation factor TFIIB
MSSPPKTTYTQMLKHIQSIYPITVVKPDVGKFNIDQLRPSDEELAKKCTSLHELRKTKCRKCGEKLKKYMNDYSYTCKCGVIVPVENTGSLCVSNDNYSPGDNGASYKAVSGGRKNRKFAITLNSCTNTDTINKCVRELKKSLSETNGAFRRFTIRQRVLDYAAEMFGIMKRHKLSTRGDKKQGIEGGCVVVACKVHGVALDETDIAEFMGIEQSKITYGMQQLQKYHNKNIITIPQNYDQTPDKITAFLETLGMNDAKRAHFKFIKKIIYIANKHGIEDISKCQDNTKCIGIIYSLFLSLGKDLTRKQIIDCCGAIGNQTIKSVHAAMVNNYAVLERVYEKYNIPPPAAALRKRKKESPNIPRSRSRPIKQSE